MASFSTTKLTQWPAMENDMYVHLVNDVKEYRLAINRMGEDIFRLRSENNQLREEMNLLQQIANSNK